jgi:hypothetical protein
MKDCNHLPEKIISNAGISIFFKIQGKKSSWDLRFARFVFMRIYFSSRYNALDTVEAFNIKNILRK